MTAKGLTLPEPIKPTSSPEPQALPGARLALLLLLSINMFNYIDRQVLSAVLPAIEKEFFPKSAGGSQEYTEAMLGLLATAFMVTYMISAPIFGWLADRVSRWVLIGIGIIWWSLASGASGWAPTFTALLLTRCLVGVGEGAYGPAAPTLISDLYPARRRSSVLAWFYMAIPVGSALGYALGGLVLGLTKSEAAPDGKWRWAFYVVVVPGLLLGLWSFFMREPKRGQMDLGETGPMRKGGLKDYRTFLLTPSYILNTLGMTAMTFAAGGLAYWMPRYINLDRGMPDLAEINLIFGAIVVLAGLVATLLGGVTGDWLRPKLRGAYFLMSGYTMLFAFPMILLVLWTPFPLAWVFVFGAVFCLYFNTGPTNSILANVTHPAVRASAFAVNIFIIHAAGDAISPALIGLIAGLPGITIGSVEFRGMELGFIVVSFTVLIGSILWIWGAHYLERDTELAPTRLNEPA
jgi:predicted MFS family arabinose efflux permease